MKDLLKNIGIPLIILGIAWILSSIATMQKDVAVLMVRLETTMQSHDKLQEDFHKFAQHPRFTNKDFIDNIKPLIKSIHQNKSYIKHLESRNDD